MTASTDLTIIAVSFNLDATETYQLKRYMELTTDENELYVSNRHYQQEIKKLSNNPIFDKGINRRKEYVRQNQQSIDKICLEINQLDNEIGLKVKMAIEQANGVPCGTMFSYLDTFAKVQTVPTIKKKIAKKSLLNKCLYLLSVNLLADKETTLTKDTASIKKLNKVITFTNNRMGLISYHKLTTKENELLENFHINATKDAYKIA